MANEDDIFLRTMDLRKNAVQDRSSMSLEILIQNSFMMPMTRLSRGLNV